MTRNPSKTFLYRFGIVKQMSRYHVAQDLTVVFRSTIAAIPGIKTETMHYLELPNTDGTAKTVYITKSYKMAAALLAHILDSNNPRLTSKNIGEAFDLAVQYVNDCFEEGITCGTVDEEFLRYSNAEVRAELFPFARVRGPQPA